MKLGERSARTCLRNRLQQRLLKKFLRQDGAVAVEMVLVSMLLVPLVCGLLDFAMLWQKHQTAEAAMRQAARRVASSCVVPLNDLASDCKSGNKSEDDTKALLAALSALGNAASEIETVVIFNANDASTSDLNATPPAGCLTAAPPTGVANECNVYGPDQLAGIGALTPADLAVKFSCTSHQTPDPGKPSSYWCPLDRGRSSNTPSYVGVAVKLRHRHITGLFGSFASVKAQAVFRLEPNTLAPTEVRADDVDVLVAAPTSTTTTTTEVPTSTTTTTTIQTAWYCDTNAITYSSLADYTTNCPPPPTITSTTTTTTIQTTWYCDTNGFTYSSLASYTTNCPPPPTITSTTTTTTIQTTWWCSYNNVTYYSQNSYDSACVPPPTSSTTTTTRVRTKGGGNT